MPGGEHGRVTQPSFPLIAGLMLSAMTFIVIGDASGKALTVAGVSPLFVAWSRFALGALMLWPVSGLGWRDLRAMADWRLALRAVLIVGGIASILTALRTEPLANAFGGFFIGPIVSYFLSALILRERISLARTILLGIGFIGILIVLRPGLGLRPGMGFAMLAGCFYGAFLVSTRWLAGSYRPRFLLMSQLLIGAIVLAPVGLGGALPAPSWGLLGLVALSAGGSAIGNYIVVRVNRVAEASVVAPLVYSQLIAATVVGYLAFGDWPDAMTLIGLCVIIASGLASLTLVHRAGRKAAGQ